MINIYSNINETFTPFSDSAGGNITSDIECNKCVIFHYIISHLLTSCNTCNCCVVDICLAISSKAHICLMFDACIM